MIYIILVMVLIPGIIFAVQYKIASQQNKLNMKNIIETTILWSVISYIILGIIVLGITFLATSQD